MDNGINLVIQTVDEYSYILNAKKVTIAKGERFVQLDRPNKRWVLARRLSGDQQQLLLPVRIVSPSLLDSGSYIVAGLSNGLSFDRTELFDHTTDSLSTMSKVPSNSDISGLRTLTISNPNESANAIQTIRTRNHTIPNKKDNSSGSESLHQSGTILNVSGADTKVARSDGDVAMDQPKLRHDSADSEKLAVSNQKASNADPQPQNSVIWRRQITDGMEVFVNTQTDEQWAPAVDSTGQTYYYEINTRRSVWELQDFEGVEEEEEDNGTQLTDPTPSLSSMNAYLTASSTGGVTAAERSQADDAIDEFGSWSSSENESFSLSPSGDQSSGQNEQKKHKTTNKSQSKNTERPGKSTGLRLSRLNTLNIGTNRTNSSTSLVPKWSPGREDDLSNHGDNNDGRFNLRQIGKEHISGPEENKLTNFERRAMVSRTKFFEQGRRVSKKWSEALMVLSGPWLFLYRDVKAATPKSNNPFGKPEVYFHVQQLQVTDATGEDTSRKCVLKLSANTPGNLQPVYLVQLPENVLDSWKAAFRYANELLNDERRSTTLLARSTIRNRARPPSKLDTSLVAKMREFFRTRPSAESLRARGILKNEPVFASTLVQVCEQENSDVPRFIVCVVRAIEARGLDHLGLYRLSANASEVQKLRCCVNQYNYSLNSEKWSLDVLAGGLKLFFRELKEPLFTFELFPRLVKLFAGKPDESSCLTTMRELIFSMPTPHISTARVLFHHLFRVLQHSDVNQMHAHKLAIVFGPNLVRSDTEIEHLGMLTSVQAPCVDFCLKHVVELFGPVVPPPVVT